MNRPAATDTSTYDLRLALPLAAFFFVFLLAPLAILVYVSLHTDAGMTAFGLTQYAKFLLDPFSLKVLGHTLWIGVEVTALCLLLGLPMAWVYVRVPGWAQAVPMRHSPATIPETDARQEVRAPVRMEARLQ